MTILYQWAADWGIPAAALEDYKRRVGIDTTGPAPATIEPVSEAAAIAEIRLEASRKGGRAWRNQVGAGKLDSGNFVRFGLCNDSAVMNKNLKSSDLIGPMPRLITPAMVGQIVGVFTAREVKEPGWKYTASGREPAQLAFIELVNSLGGDARFATGTGTL